jgi:hypothetical protein
MEKDRINKGGRLDKTGNKKDAERKSAVVVLFDSRKPIEAFRSYIEQNILAGEQAFLFIARSARDLDGAKKLAESFRGEDGIVKINENLDDRLNTADRGVIALYRPIPSVKKKGK